jgi:hypothetical protein
MGKRRKRQEWLIGDVFVVRQLDEMCSLGQVLTLMMPNVVSCAFFDIRLSCDGANGAIELSLQQLIAVMSVTRERLDFGEWTIVGHQHVTVGSGAVAERRISPEPLDRRQNLRCRNRSVVPQRILRTCSMGRLERSTVFRQAACISRKEAEECCTD